MFENTTHLHVLPGKFDESLRILRAEIIPILRQQPGLLSLALIPQKDQNTITILSAWTSRTCARLVEIDPLYRQEIRKLDALLVDEKQPDRVESAMLRTFPILPIFCN